MKLALAAEDVTETLDAEVYQVDRPGEPAAFVTSLMRTALGTMSVIDRHLIEAALLPA
jgi:hypothetical protein